MAESTVLVDFETRSVLPLKTCGAYKYASHDSTSVLCLGYRLPGSFTEIFIPGEKVAADLVDAINDPNVIFEAHNANFDRLIWNNVFAPDYGLPEIPIERWRCSAARCAAVGLPRDLKNAALLLGLPEQKQVLGKRLIDLLCKPIPSTLSPGKTPKFSNDGDLLYRLYDYCQQDVDTMAVVCESVPEMSKHEIDLYHIDQRINDRGVKIDTRLCSRAIMMMDYENVKVRERFHEITGLDSPTQREKTKRWILKEHGLPLENTSAPVIRKALGVTGLDPDLRYVLEMVTSMGRSSSAKFSKALDYADTKDERVRGMLLFYGAHTGRWAGRGLQPQNFPRLKPDGGMSLACEEVLNTDVEHLKLIHPDVRKLLSSVLRGMFIPQNGKSLYRGDYKAIEAIVLFWLAGEEQALSVFRSGGDIYCSLASYIFGRTITPADEFERWLGKAAILGLGYGMGAVTFVKTMRANGVELSFQHAANVFGSRSKLDEAMEYEMDKLLSKSDAHGNLMRSQIAGFFTGSVRDIVHEIATARKIVNQYRTRYPGVPSFWARENSHAVAAASGTPQGKWGMEVIDKNRWLFRTLPAGRRISYFEPKASGETNLFGQPQKTLTYRVVVNESGATMRTATFGGKIVENIVQAVARDVMSSAMTRLDASGIPVVCTVHDEILCECDSTFELRRFEKIMTETPDWADGLPLQVDAQKLQRYEK